jgi:hypothetical protein
MEDQGSGAADEELALKWCGMRNRLCRYSYATLFILALLAYAGDSAVPQPPFERIDAHFHAASTDPLFFDMLKRHNMRVLNICADDMHDNVLKWFPDIVKEPLRGPL